MTNLGTLKKITDLRSIWPHEALNFTPWVAENVDLLADAVGLDITVDETESSVGDFNVDISYGHTEVDAKSLLGMLSLDFNRIMHVKYYGKNEDLEGYINELAVE